jgi:phosphoglycolate phosphatase
MKYSCVIFDCDGTLVDTLEDIAASMNRALRCHGFPALPLEQYRERVGRGILHLAARSLPEDARNEAVVQKVAAGAARFYEEEPLVKSKLYPGIAELLAELRGRKKIKLAVLSNKPDPVLRLVIGGLFPPQTFDAVQGDRPGEARKPDPTLVWDLLVRLDRDSRDAILMGDSEIDMETARGAGCYPLGVSWGFRPRAELEAAGAARIISRPGEMLDLL